MLGIQNDKGFFALLPAHTADAHGGADGIHIGVAVSHNEHLAALPDQLHEGVGGDTGTHLAAVIGFGTLAAVEGEVDPILDNRLVAAPAEGHLDGQSGEVVAFLEVGAVHAQTDGHGRGKPGGTFDLMNALQQGELVLGGPGQIPFFKNEQEAVALQLPQKAVIPVGPLGNGIAQLGVQGGDGAFGEILGQLLIVVHQNDGNHGTGADILVPHLIEQRQITEIQNPEGAAVGVVGPEHGAVDPVAAILDGDIVGGLGLSGGEPVGGQAGNGFIQSALLQAVGQGTDGIKFRVVPDDVAVLQPDHQGGEGISSLAHGLNRGGAAAQIPGKILAAEAAAQSEKHNGQYGDRQLSYSQDRLTHQERGKAEAYQHGIIKAHPGIDESGQPSFHSATSFGFLPEKKMIHLIIANLRKRRNCYFS